MTKSVPNSSAPLQIFGAGQTAEAIIDMVVDEALFDIVAVCVDDTTEAPSTIRDIPLISLSDANKSIPIFVGIGFNRLNHDRAQVYERLKTNGYTFASIVSNRATVRSSARIGENCLLMEQNNIQASVDIGNNTYLWSGNHIGHHTTIGSHCYISSHCVVSGAVTIGDYSFIGVNASIGDNLEIGTGCIVGQGALIGKSIPDYSIVKSDPSAVFTKDEETNRRILRR